MDTDEALAMVDLWRTCDPELNEADLPSCALADEVRTLRARVAELEAAAGEPTGTDWGAHWPETDPRCEDVESEHHDQDGGEAYARRIVAQYRGAVLVKRIRGPWLPAS